MRYKNPTPNPLPASDEGAKMYLIGAETAVSLNIKTSVYGNFNRIGNIRVFRSELLLVISAVPATCDKLLLNQLCDVLKLQGYDKINLQPHPQYHPHHHPYKP